MTPPPYPVGPKTVSRHAWSRWRRWPAPRCFPAICTCDSATRWRGCTASAPGACRSWDVAPRRPGANPGGPAAQVHRTDCLHRRHRRVLRGRRGDQAGRPSSRDRLCPLDRDQHLPTGGGAPVHLAREVYGGAVPLGLLDGAGGAARGARPGGRELRGVSGDFRSVVLLVATDGLRKLDAPGRIRTCHQQLRRPLLYPTELRAADCAATTYGAVLHRASKQCHKQCQNLMLPCPEAQGRELLLQDLLVLLQAILHHLGAVPHRTEVPVDPLHQGFAAVPELATHREDGHRRSVVRRLDPRARVRVPEDLGREFTHLPTRSHRDGVEQLSKVCQHRLSTRSERRE